MNIKEQSDLIDKAIESLENYEKYLEKKLRGSK
jgi:hypothetical protein